MDVRLNVRDAVVFEKVSKVYHGRWPSGRVLALDEVSLAVHWGEVLGLIGPNRAGKTTLVKILLSICHPSDGRIMRFGCPWSDRSTLAEIGYVHENPSFPRYLSAWQVVEGYGRLSGVAGTTLRQRTGELLEQVGLADRSRESIARFSKGMLQRLALAQALINDPKLLVLDEPSEGMDLSARKLLHEVILERRRRGYSVILISHALPDVGLLCDRIALMREGRLVRVGRVDELTKEVAAPAGSPVDSVPAFDCAVASIYEGALA